ncbi:MAG: hypothetical protein ABL923_03525 [Burkholderiaceae bacterium]
MTNLSPQAVLDAVSDVSNLWFDIELDLLQRTWQCGHVRVVVLLASHQTTSDAQLLARVISRTGSGRLLPAEWFPNVYFQHVNLESLKSLITYAINDITENSYLISNSMESLLKSLPCEDIQNIFEIEAHKNPGSPFNYGPTYQMFWKKGDYFYYLEHHYES